MTPRIRHLINTSNTLYSVYIVHRCQIQSVPTDEDEEKRDWKVEGNY